MAQTGLGLRRRGVARETLGLVLGLLPVLLIAFVVFHLIRSHLLERYLVPSSSMEPALYGDAVDGDIVLVDKTAFWASRPQRWDLVVLRNPGDVEHGHLVKRVVATAGELVRLEHGDVYIAQAGAGEPRLLQKSLAVARRMRQTWFALPPTSAADLARALKSSSGWTVSGDELRLAPAAASLSAMQALLGEHEQRQRRTGQSQSLSLYVPGHLSTAEPVTATFVDSRGKLHHDPTPVMDFGIEVDAVPEVGCEGLQLVFEYRDEYYAVVYTPAGQACLTLMGNAAEPIVTGRAGPALRAGVPIALAFGHLDGRFFLEADGAALFEHDLDLPAGVAGEEKFRGQRIDNLLHVGVAGAPLRITRLRVFHDVHYDSLQAPTGRSPAPQLVPEASLWLLGDNSRFSRDSRDRQIGAYPMADLVGKPVAVIGPWARMRCLSR